MSTTSKDPSRRKSEAASWFARNPTRRQLSKWQREQRRRRIVLSAAFAVGALIVAVLAAGYLREVVLRGQEPVATVYGEVITAGDLVQTARPFYTSLSRQRELLREAGLMEQAAQADFQMRVLAEQALEAEIETRLLMREARSRGIVITDEQVRAEIREQIEMQAALEQGTLASPDEEGLALSDEEFDRRYRDLLRQIGYNDLEYRERLRDEIATSTVRSLIGVDLPSSAEQVHARHILVDGEEKAQELLAQLADGASFEELAREESNDTGSRANGGDLGWFPRGMMVAEFEQAAFEAEPGSDPLLVQSQFGWHIVEVLEHNADRPLEEQALGALQARHYQEWLQREFESDRVEIHLTRQHVDWVLRRLQSRLF